MEIKHLISADDLSAAVNACVDTLMRTQVKDWDKDDHLSMLDYIVEDALVRTLHGWHGVAFQKVIDEES